MEAATRRCNNCGAAHSEDAPLKRCARCSDTPALYCGRSCQLEHWAILHREECTKVYEVCRTEEKGVGLRAARPFRAGDVLFAESPVLRAPVRISADEQEDAWASVNRSFLSLSVGRQRAVMDLYCTPARLDAGGDKPLSGICQSNAVEMGESGESGLFLKFSRLNHCCRSNVRHTWREDRQRELVIATRDINAGDELLTCYLDTDTGFSDTETRRAWLQERFGFLCNCEMCSRDGEGDTPGNRRMRELSALHASIPEVAQTSPESALEMVDRCLRLLREQQLDMVRERPRLSPPPRAQLPML